MRYLIVFLLGVLLGSLTITTSAQDAVVLFGTVSGVATPIAVDSSGYINVIGH